jgi:uncharacterized membrane protein
VDGVVVYNELVALTAGAGLLGFAAFLAYLIKGKRIESEGWAGFFAVTGVLLLALGVHTTVTWPFGGNGFEYANIAFGQPAAGFGALLLFAGVYLWRHRALYAGAVEEANAATLSAFKPVGIFVGALGLGMAVLAITFVRLQLGAAPPEEPISGRFGHLPILEALFLGGLWGVVALGTARRHRLVDRPAAAAALGRVGLGHRRHGVPALRRDELPHAHRHVLQHRARHHAQVVTLGPATRTDARTGTRTALADPRSARADPAFQPLASHCGHTGGRGGAWSPPRLSLSAASASG